MAILFSDIYTKAIALFDDPKISKAYNTNELQFDKIMYTYLQNAIALFTNPASIGMRLADYTEPSGLMDVIDSDGSEEARFITVDPSIDLTKSNCVYQFIEGELNLDPEDVKVNKEANQVIFPHVLPAGQQYAIEQYYIGEFNDEFKSGINSKTSVGNKLVVEEIKDILARLLVKAWAEEERNLLLDIRNLMQDSDFKITGNDRVLKSKNAWVDQLDDEVLQLQNKLA